MVWMRMDKLSMTTTVGLALRLACREMRGGLQGFRIFLLCLALGVAAIAGVGSLSAGIVKGLEADGAALLGGDVELRLTQRRPTPDEYRWWLKCGPWLTAPTMRPGHSSN